MAVDLNNLATRLAQMKLVTAEQEAELKNKTLDAKDTAALGAALDGVTAQTPGGAALMKELVAAQGQVVGGQGGQFGQDAMDLGRAVRDRLQSMLGLEPPKVDPKTTPAPKPELTNELNANVQSARLAGPAVVAGAVAATKPKTVDAAAPVAGKDVYKAGPSIEQLAGGAPLQRGMSGPGVRWLQEQLNAQGAQPPLQLDGKMGPLTEAALKGYQTSRGCSDAPGVFGATTRTAFDNDSAVDPVAWKEMQTTAVREGRTSLGKRDQVSDSDLTATAREDFKPVAGGVHNGVVAMSQGDYNTPIGNSGKTIRQVGCKITAFAMAATAITGKTDLNPATAMSRIAQRNGFVGASMHDGTGAAALGMRVESRIGTHNASPAKMTASLDRALQSGRPVVVGVDYRAGSGGTAFGTGVDHWVTITGKNADGSYSAVDPAGGRSITLRPGADGLLGGNSAHGSKHYVAKEMILLAPA